MSQHSERHARTTCSPLYSFYRREVIDFEELLGIKSQGYKDITVVDAVQWMMVPGNDFVYLDVRSEEEHEELVPPKSAVNIPAFTPINDWEDPELAQFVPVPTFVRDVQARYGVDSKLLVGCRAGYRSGAACKLLAEAGYKHLWNVESGAWLKTRQTNEDF
eukprot:16173-Heterococcus_DN1.PRE.2